MHPDSGPRWTTEMGVRPAAWVKRPALEEAAARLYPAALVLVLVLMLVSVVHRARFSGFCFSKQCDEDEAEDAGEGTLRGGLAS